MPLPFAIGFLQMMMHIIMVADFVYVALIGCIVARDSDRATVICHQCDSNRAR